MSSSALGDGIRVTMLVRNGFTNDTRVEREARSLAQAGYRVTIVAEARDGLPERELKAEAQVRRVPRRGPNLPGARFVAYGWQLEQALQRTRPQILHAHDADALATVGPVAHRLAIPFVYDSHELWLGRTRRGRSRIYDALSRTYYRRLEARYLPRAAAVIVANPGVAPELEQRYQIRDVRPVPNYPQLDGALERRELRERPGAEDLPAGVPVILYVGGLMPDRGLEQTLAVLVRLPSAHLALLGAGGAFEPTVRAEAARLGVAARVHYIPPVPSELVVPYAASATVGVSAIQPASLSYRLALPNKLFQCMAAGIPLVASDFPDVREVVEGSGAGVVVDPTDPSAIAAAVDDFISDPERAAQAGAAGRRAVVERYNWTESERVLLGVYARISAP